MNNLRKFLDYNSKCPLCSGALNFRFISNNTKEIRFVDDGMEVELDINAFPAPKQKNKFKVNLRINYDDNNFLINFIEFNATFLNYVSLSKIDDCKNFIDKVGVQLYRVCNICNNYSYVSENLTFDFLNKTIRPFGVRTEQLKMRRENNETVKLYELTNHYGLETSALLFNTYPQIDPTDLRAKMREFTGTTITSQVPAISMPLIKITDSESLMDRLDMLITFS